MYVVHVPGRVDDGGFAAFLVADDVGSDGEAGDEALVKSMAFSCQVRAAVRTPAAAKPPITSASTTTNQPKALDKYVAGNFLGHEQAAEHARRAPALGRRTSAASRVKPAATDPTRPPTEFSAMIASDEPTAALVSIPGEQHEGRDDQEPAANAEEAGQHPHRCADQEAGPEATPPPGPFSSDRFAQHCDAGHEHQHRKDAQQHPLGNHRASGTSPP